MIEVESCKLGTGRGNGVEDLIGKSRDGIAGGAGDYDVEEGEVREVREERG